MSRLGRRAHEGADYRRGSGRFWDEAVSCLLCRENGRRRVPWSVSQAPEAAGPLNIPKRSAKGQLLST